MLYEKFVVNGFEIYFVSFLEGVLRIFLFTHDLELAIFLSHSAELEKADFKLQLFINDLGVSYVDNKSKTELLYLSLDCSIPVWGSDRKFIKLSKSTAKILEGSRQNGRLTFINRTNDSEMYSYNLWGEERRVVRRSNLGLWIKYGKSDKAQWAHIQINHLQLNCQQRKSAYFVILSPVLASNTARTHKPFIEASLFLRSNNQVPVPQVKYASLLFQEFKVNIDLAFILDLFESFGAEDTCSKHFISQETIDLYKQNLFSFFCGKQPNNSTLFYLDVVHISPLKFTLSLSVDDIKTDRSGWSYIIAVIKALMSTLISVTSIPFRLGYFEERSCVYTLSNLFWNVVNHFKEQTMRQFYAIVLGADALGNPYGLIHNFSSGITDLFYEPIQGAVKGPEEFAQGLVTGVQSFFGNVVGGTANSFSLFFGFSGRFFSSLSFDGLYKKRRILNKKRATTAQMILYFGLKEFWEGVLMGVFGIFVKPVQYGRLSQCTGVMKGFSIGVIGILVRPLAGIVDLLSSVFEMFKVLLQSYSVITSSRFGRVITPEGQIFFYSAEEAEMNYLYRSHSNGEHELIYFGRCRRPKKAMCFLTTRHIFVLKSNLLNDVTVCWTVEFADIIVRPSLADKGIVFSTRGVCGHRYYSLQMEDNTEFLYAFNNVLDNSS